MLIKGRYEYDPSADLLGKGGFARVFRARDQLLNRQIALKVFSHLGHDQYSVLAEIRKAIQLEHPNLLRYYDVLLLEQSNALGESEELQIGVMEYANAGDLKSYVRAHPGSPLLLRFLREILKGLEYLHAHGIIHRDLKAQNILLVERGGELTAKISDFGISKNMSADDAGSSSMLVGTIEYMAPEQFNPRKFGIDGKVGPNVDLWAFGVMVHELLTDATPFGRRDGNTTAEQIMAAILAPDLPDRIKALPEPFRAMVKRCLVANATARIRSASDLLNFLGEPEFEPSIRKDMPLGEVDATKAYAKGLDAVKLPQTEPQIESEATRLIDLGEAQTEPDPSHETDLAAKLQNLEDEADHGTEPAAPEFGSVSNGADDLPEQHTGWWRKLTANRGVLAGIVLVALFSIAFAEWFRPPPPASVSEVQFLAEVFATPGVYKASSGMITLPVVSGQGASPKPQDFVAVRINLAKADGSQTFSDPNNLAVVPLSSLAPPLRDAIREMKPGGTIRFWLPAALAEPKMLATPRRRASPTAPRYSNVTTLVGTIALEHAGTQVQVAGSIAKPSTAQGQSSEATTAKVAAKTSDGVQQAPPKPSVNACREECSMVASTPKFTDRVANVRAGEFSYPSSVAIPQDRARTLAGQVCSNGSGSLVTYSAKVDGACGGNICFAAVTATCRYRDSSAGAPVRTCRSVCN